MRLAIFLAVLGLAGSASSTVFLPVDDALLVARSAVIVTGEVIASTARRDGARIVTDTTIAVARTMKGSVAGATVTVTTPGGRVGDDAVVIFGAPRFVRGESVLVFLQRTPRGALRTTALAYGAFRIERAADGTERAIRDDPGPEVRDVEEFAALAQALADPGEAVSGDALAAPLPFGGGAEGDAFTFLGSSPARWFEPDTNVTIRLRVANADPKLGAGTSNAVIDAALAAWTDVPSATITLERGASTATGPSIASGVCDGVSTVQFADPADELPDLAQCSGIVALGGFCIGAGTRVVNGIQFRRIVEGDLTVARGAGQCFDRRGFEEVVTHEVGHVIGLGHSSNDPSEPNTLLRDATMYFLVHLDGRGASLRADDIAGVTASYPVVVDPNDLDADGVPNDDDDCPTTPGAPVDAHGCACGEDGHASCDDGLGCTNDFCDASSGECAAAPVDCSGGDPCVAGSCDETTGCATLPVTGAAAVLCPYGRPYPPSACVEDRVPRFVGRAYREAGRLVRRGLDSGNPRFVARAAVKLDRARTRVARSAARRRRALPAACAVALDAFIADAQSRLADSN